METINNMSKFPDVALSYDERIPADVFEDFESFISKTGLSYTKESQEHGPFAGVEWLLPTAVILFIGKAYFDSFFKEMGKDHYHLIKNGLHSFRKKFLSEAASNQYKRVSVPSTKTPKDPIFSILFSIMAKTKNGQNIKFLYPVSISEQKFHKSTEAFLNLLAENYSAENDDLSIQLQSFTRKQDAILVRFNQSSQKAEIIDPVEEIRRQKHPEDMEKAKKSN
ncbi:MAG: hypothetical protein GXP60_05150 [Epsilonproteobacteria bacterium]|nr:hypothetical protein [Campylobacterota bacterium]